MKDKIIQTTVIIEKDLYEKLVEIKTERGTPFVFIINKALREYFNKKENHDRSD